MGGCHYKNRDSHPLTKNYWQTDEHGDICDPCHKDYLAERKQNEGECRRHRCRNAARYTSGYCGVCDVTHNGGEGVRIGSAPDPRRIADVVELLKEVWELQPSLRLGQLIESVRRHTENTSLFYLPDDVFHYGLAQLQQELSA